MHGPRYRAGVGAQERVSFDSIRSPVRSRASGNPEATCSNLSVRCSGSSLSRGRTDRATGSLLAKCGLVLAALSLAVIVPLPAAAQADFYRGKTIELIISTGVGGGLDTNARIVARHLAKHIPGTPTIVPKNMPGAGHIRAANYVFSQAPKDGTTIGTFIPIFVMAQVLERSRSIQFDPAQFNWLISTASNNSTIYTWHKAGIKTVEDAT